MTAALLWTGLFVVTFSTRDSRNLVDHLKGEDFIQLYTLAHTAFEGPYPTISTYEAFHRRQVELVPASAPDYFFPVYPPTAALLFRPFALLPYGWAALCWAALTVLVYALIVWGAWCAVRNSLPDWRFVALAAAAFPPLPLHVLFGQTSVVPLAAFFLFWLALERKRPLVAGFALGLLTVKPHFAIVVGPLLVLGRHYAVLLGVGISLAAQASAVVATMGWQAVEAYQRTIAEIPTVEHLLEPDPWRMHSVRTLTRLIGQPAGDLLWGAASLIIILSAYRAWRSSAPLSVRVGTILLATTLVSPHLFVYDAVILAPAIIWLGAWVVKTQPQLGQAFWQAIYFLAFAFLIPTALFLKVQLTVLLMLWMYWRLTVAVTSSIPAAVADDR